jgi:hypothetical protein
MTPAAVAQDTACSDERPPKTTATLGLCGGASVDGGLELSVSLIACDPIARQPTDRECRTQIPLR